MLGVNKSPQVQETCFCSILFLQAMTTLLNNLCIITELLCVSTAILAHVGLNRLLHFLFGFLCDQLILKNVISSASCPTLPARINTFTPNTSLVWVHLSLQNSLMLDTNSLRFWKKKGFSKKNGLLQTAQNPYTARQNHGHPHITLSVSIRITLASRSYGSRPFYRHVFSVELYCSRFSFDLQGIFLANSGNQVLQLQLLREQYFPSPRKPFFCSRRGVLHF